MNTRTVPGTSILIVLILISIITLAGLATFNSAVFVASFCSARIGVEQQFRLAQGLLEYGVAIAQSSDNLLKNEENTVIDLPLDPYIGKISFERKDDAILITAWLSQKEKIICPLSCQVTKKTDKKLVIESFQRKDFSL